MLTRQKAKPGYVYKRDYTSFPADAPDEGISPMKECNALSISHWTDSHYNGSNVYDQTTTQKLHRYHLELVAALTHPIGVCRRIL